MLGVYSAYLSNILRWWLRTTRRLLILGVSITNLPQAQAFSPSDVELQLADMTRSHSAQGRPEMIYDPMLSLAARAKARDMGVRNYAAHIDPDGYGANKASQLAGYRLPEWWPNELNSNFIESLAFGYGSAQKAFDAWLGSSAHLPHVLGQTDFYQGQTRYGFGYAEVSGSTYTRYYVFLSAPPSRHPVANLEPYTEWLFDHYRLQQIDTTLDTTDLDGDGLPLLLEFALDLNPYAEDTLPDLEFLYGREVLAWPISIRDDLGSIQVGIEGSSDLKQWTVESAPHVAGAFQLPLGKARPFLRVAAWW